MGALGATPMCIAIGVGTLGVSGLVCGVVVVVWWWWWELHRQSGGVPGLAWGEVGGDRI